MTHTYFALVESVRTDAGPRQQVVAHLGELNADQQRRWQRTTVFYNRQGDAEQLRLFPDDELAPLPDDPDVVRVRIDDIAWTNARRFGDVFLARWLWQLLQLDAIVDRHVPAGKETVRPADVVAIEVINRLCAPCSEFALAEHWYASTGLEDLLGVADENVTKDRLYRTLDQLLTAQTAIENDLKQRFEGLFQLDYDLLLYDLTSSYFEGLAEENDSGPARLLTRSPQRLSTNRAGFDRHPRRLPAGSRDVGRQHQGRANRASHRQHRRTALRPNSAGVGDGPRHDQRGHVELPQRTEPPLSVGDAAARIDAVSSRTAAAPAGRMLPDHPGVAVKTLERDGVHYLLGPQRRPPQKGTRHSPPPTPPDDARPAAAAQARGQRAAQGPRQDSRSGRPHQGGRAESAARSSTIEVATIGTCRVGRFEVEAFRAALTRDGAYLLRSNQGGWTAAAFWETYMQLATVERAFRVLKSELLLRPIWHHYSGRTKAHVFVCVLAYALWKTLDHLAKRAGLMTEIRKPDPARGQAAPKPTTDDAGGDLAHAGSNPDRRH